MNRLSKEKKSQLVLVAILVISALVGLWFSLIRAQQEKLQTLAARKETSINKLSQIRDSIKNSKLIEAQLNVISNKLALEQEDMASGDLYASMVNSLRKFKLRYKIEIPQFSSAGQPVEMNLLPKFPYKQVSVTIAGTGLYHELGKFMADFENQFPTSRIVGLELAPASVQSSDAKENLSFKMDIVFLVVPNGAPAVKTP
jgi:Tfp pilus assembly protein PilO